MKHQTNKPPMDLERLSDELDLVFDSHGVTLPLRIAWATALLGAAHDSPHWAGAWEGIPREMMWMREISKLCAQRLTPIVAEMKGDDSN